MVPLAHLLTALLSESCESRTIYARTVPLPFKKRFSACFRPRKPLSLNKNHLLEQSTRLELFKPLALKQGLVTYEYAIFLLYWLTVQLAVQNAGLGRREEGFGYCFDQVPLSAAAEKPLSMAS